MAALPQEEARRRVAKYLTRCNPERVKAVVPGQEIFADGSRHLYVRYWNDRFASVGRPVHGIDQLYKMLSNAIMDVRRGQSMEAVRDKVLRGDYDHHPAGH